MVASRVTAALLRAAAPATLVGLAGWLLAEAFLVPAAGAAEVFGILVGVAVVLVLADAWKPIAFLRRAASVLLLAVYVAMHAGYLGIEVVPALAFVSVVLAAVPLRFLTDRFAPLYRLDLSDDARRRVGAALARSFLRVVVVGVLAVLVPLVAADLGLAGTVPSTTIPTAVILAGGLIAVVLLLALLPTLERRAG